MFLAVFLKTRYLYVLFYQHIYGFLPDFGKLPLFFNFQLYEFEQSIFGSDEFNRHGNLTLVRN